MKPALLNSLKPYNLIIMNKLFLLVLLFLCACRHPAEKVSYPTRDYLVVGKMMDTIKPPYIVDASAGKKHVVLIGCDHNRDPKHPQFALIEQYFKKLKPQIAFNEGGQLADTSISSFRDGIIKHGESGALKYLSDQSHIKMLDGDMTDSAEFKAMLKKYPKDKLFLYYVMERMVIPYVNGAYGKTPFEAFYIKSVKPWFAEPGFPLNEQEQRYEYFTGIYHKYVGTDFKPVITNDIERFDYLNSNCEFCAIGRASKMVRDSTLLSKIDNALNSNDRVMVTFGQGHALAIEPALRQMVAKHR